MSRLISSICTAGLLLGAVVWSQATLLARPALAEGVGSATPHALTPSAAVPDGQVYELRIYTASEGKMDALNKRFREHTLRLFEKHGIKSIGYWTAEDEGEGQRLYYLIAYPDRESREKMLVNGIAADPEFRQVIAESEKDGKLTSAIESVILLPTDYSPLR